MTPFHQQNRRIYDYVTAKLRENSLLGYLSTKIERLPSVYRYPPPHAASSGMKPSSPASVKFSRTRRIRKPKAVSSLKASSITMKKSIRCWPKTTLSIQWICPLTRSLSTPVGTLSTRFQLLPSLLKSIRVLLRLQRATTTTWEKRSIWRYQMN